MYLINVLGAHESAPNFWSPGVFKNFAKFKGKQVSFAQVLYSEFCEVFKNTSFYRTLPVTFSTRKLIEIDVNISFFVILLSVYQKIKFCF